MEITVNGQTKTFLAPISAESLINTSCKKPELVICELNGAILDRKEWVSTQLKTHDRIELISFVGGG
ncbi:MAG: sulfur carrier protein ThiS [Candidatus Omnitrophica bacterium]|nr:sulfur carrier protein ThiS [Candidatus Omnitrophota bacterium]